MTPQRAQQLVAHCYDQQQRWNQKDREVCLVIPGGWGSGFRRLDGRAGPKGRCMSENENDVLALFKADEVIAYCAKFLPTISLAELEPTR